MSTVAVMFLHFVICSLQQVMFGYLAATGNTLFVAGNTRKLHENDNVQFVVMSTSDSLLLATIPSFESIHPSSQYYLR